MLTLLKTLVTHPPNRSVQSPGSFWSRAHILDIQQAGESQSVVRNLFGGALHYEYGLNIDQITSDGQTFVYLDDALLYWQPYHSRPNRMDAYFA